MEKIIKTEKYIENADKMVKQFRKRSNMWKTSSIYNRNRYRTLYR